MKVFHLTVLLLGSLLHGETVEWVGLAGDGELYNPANWDTRARPGSVQPPPKTWVDPQGLFAYDLLIYEAGISSQQPIVLDGRKLQLGRGGTLALIETGVGNTETRVSEVLLENGHLHTRYLARVSAVLSGTSTLTLEGPNNCLNETLIEVPADSTPLVTFTNKPIARVRAEDLQKFTRNGKPLKENVDVILEARGDGTILRFQAR